MTGEGVCWRRRIAIQQYIIIMPHSFIALSDLESGALTQTGVLRGAIAERQRPMATTINDQLFIGSAFDAGLLQFSNPLNIGAVVNVALEPDDPVEGIVNVHIPMDDGEISERTFDKALAAIRGISNLTACWFTVAGTSRSAVVITLYLATTEGISLDAALFRLKKLRPKVSPTPETLESAKRYLEQRKRKLKTK
jgi:Dual specificity phosphatase, catalytic domain